MNIRINRWTNSNLNCNELDEEMCNVQAHYSNVAVISFGDCEARFAPEVVSCV